MSDPVPVIDLFAGPGGLGEGFASLERPDGTPAFSIRLSIEKEEIAVRTLKLRAFRRQFGERLPQAVRSLYVRGPSPAAIAAAYAAHDAQARAADAEAWQCELGPASEADVRKRVAERLPKNTPWVLIGGPPCQAYSLVGRSRNRGVAGYVAERDERQTLYVEYLKVIAQHEPAVFVMENVKGLLSATVASQRMFDRIVEDLADPAKALGRKGTVVPYSRRPRYRIVPVVKRGQSGSNEVASPSDFVVRAERFGVPQARHRVILLGIHEDMVRREPGTLVESAALSVGEMLADICRPYAAGSRMTRTPTTAGSACCGSSEALRGCGHVSRTSRNGYAKC